MPDWIQLILAAAAVVTALGVLWRKVVTPSFRLASAADELVPLLREFTEAFKGTPQVFAILDDMAREFRTDGGSSLRDVINKLEELISGLTVAGEAARQLSADDRRTLARVVLLLDVLGVKADDQREDRAVVAEALAKAQTAVDGVATDLAASHERADAHIGDDAGAAADAASRSSDDEPAPAPQPRSTHDQSP